MVKCRRCSDPLVVGENWQAGYARRGNKVCRTCNTAIYLDWRRRNLTEARNTQRKYETRTREQKRQRERLRVSLYPGKERERRRIRDQKRTMEGKRAAACALRRLRVRGNGLPTSVEERDAIGNLYAWARWCTQQSSGLVKHHVDHVIPVARGGPHRLHNLQITLASFNQAKGDKLLT